MTRDQYLNHCVIHILFSQMRLNDYFIGLKNYLFCEAPDFAEVFCHQLSSKVFYFILLLIYFIFCIFCIF